MKIIFSASKKVALVCSGAAIVAACGWTRGTQNSARVSSEFVPQSTVLQQLTAKVSGSTQGLRGVLISSAEHGRVFDLSNSFYVQTDGTTHLAGTITANTQVPSHFQAVTTAGQLITCSTSARANSTLSQNAQFTIQCGDRQLQIQLDTDAANVQILDFERVKKSLLFGALVRLKSDNENIEVRLNKNVIHVYQNKESIQFKLSSEVENLLSIQGTYLSLSGEEVCQNNPCSDTLKKAELSMNEEKLTLRISSTDNLKGKIFFARISKRLSVSSYNVENFWDDDPNNSQPYNDFSSLYSNWYVDNFSSKKAERIKAALLSAGLPDVVGLQEIESANNKSRALELLKPVLSELGYNYYALGLQAEDNPTAVTTAVISKHPIVDNKRVDFVYAPDSLPEDKKHDFVGSSRDPQRVSVALPEGHSFALINSHWKSKRDKSPYGDDMRNSVARLIKQHSDSLAYENGAPVPVVIVGDFNADYREDPVQTGLQLASSLNSARSEGHPKQLVPLWLTLDAREQGSYPHDSHLQALDNIVVTASFLQGSKLTLSEPLWIAGKDGHSAQVLANADGQPLRSQIVKYKGSQGNIHARHFDIGYSDHFPLVATFSRVSLAAPILLAPEIEKQNSETLQYVQIQGSECGSEETLEVTAETLGAAQYGQCISLTKAELTLGKTGLYNVFINAAGSGQFEKPAKFIITADRAYGANKQWLRGTLQQSEGRTLTKLKGRVGFVEGQKAIFIHSPVEDIVIK